MISFKNVSYKIKKKIILNNISFLIGNNEIVLLMGISGSGKSTLLHLLSGMIFPSKGIINVDNQIVNELSENELQLYRKEKVILMNQNDDLFDNLTVLENLVMFYEIINVENILKKTKLIHLKNRKVNSLSGGERQRVYICKVCLSDASIILADEITSSLDPITSKEIITFVTTLFKDKTLIFVSHDKRLFEGLVNRSMYLENGKIQENTVLKKVVKESIIKTSIKPKSIFKICLKQGIKRISLFPLIILCMVIISLLIAFNFDTIFLYYAKESYSKYLDYDVLYVKDNDDSINENGTTILYSMDSLFEESEVKVDTINLINIRYYPFNNKSEYKPIGISNKLIGKYKIKNNSISISNKHFSYEGEYSIYEDSNMFSTSCIYYDINFFYKYSIRNNDLLIINYDFTIDDSRFTNNPMFESKSENKPYLDSKAYEDYLTFKTVFDSIKEIVDYYYVMVIIYSFITLIIVNVGLMYKDKKTIGIFIGRGYKNIEIIITYIFPFLIYSILLSFCFFIDKLVKPYLISICLYLITILISYSYIKSRSLKELLKEDSIC